MAFDRQPTRAELKQVLDDVFRRVLDDGEHARAEREPGAEPPWVPCPQDDPLYEGLEPEEWDSVPTALDVRRQDWEDAILFNRTEQVATLVDDALRARGLAPSRDGLAWRRLMRLAVISAAEAHLIDIHREKGDYRAGWPAGSRIPLQQVPAFGPEADEVTAAAATPANPSPPPAVLRATPPASSSTPPPFTTVGEAVARTAVPFAVSYESFMATKATWTTKTRSQAAAVLSRFVMLMGDLGVSDVTQSTAERFKDRLRRVPALNGRSVYGGMTLPEAAAAADRIEAALDKDRGPIRFGGAVIQRDRAAKLVQRLSLKTVNRDLSFLGDWGRWMETSDERRPLLARERNPFAGMLTKKREVEKESRRSGRKRVAFSHEEIALLVSRLPDVGGSGDDEARPGARRWAVLIGLYGGLRLGEIAQLRVADFRTEDGVLFIDLTEDAGRQLKSEAGARRIPVHPALVDAGLLDFLERRRAHGNASLLPWTSDEMNHERLASSISKWFGRYRAALGIEAPSKVFHSTRHSFSDALRASALGRDALVDQILGHEPGSVGAKVYTRPLPIGEKAALVASVTYGAANPQLSADGKRSGSDVLAA